VESIGCNSRIRIKVGIRGRIRSLYCECVVSGMLCETVSDCKIRSSRSLSKKNVEAPVVSTCDFSTTLVIAEAAKRKTRRGHPPTGTGTRSNARRAAMEMP
jgi:hypothetical protein